MFFEDVEVDGEVFLKIPTNVPPKPFFFQPSRPSVILPDGTQVNQVDLGCIYRKCHPMIRLTSRFQLWEVRLFHGNPHLNIGRFSKSSKTQARLRIEWSTPRRFVEILKGAPNCRSTLAATSKRPKSRKCSTRRRRPGILLSWPSIVKLEAVRNRCLWRQNSLRRFGICERTVRALLRQKKWR